MLVMAKRAKRAKKSKAAVDYGSMVLNQATWVHSVNDTGAF